MKRIFYLSLFVVLFSACATNRYLLLDKDQDKNFLVEYIDNLAKQKKITEHPVIVLDGKPYRFDVELKKTNCQYRKMILKRLNG